MPTCNAVTVPSLVMKPWPVLESLSSLIVWPFEFASMEASVSVAISCDITNFAAYVLSIRILSLNDLETFVGCVASANICFANAQNCKISIPGLITGMHFFVAALERWSALLASDKG